VTEVIDVLVGGADDVVVDERAVFGVIFGARVVHGFGLHAFHGLDTGRPGIDTNGAVLMEDPVKDIVVVTHGTQPGTRTPVMYQPGIVFLFSGHKIGYINERVFRYDTNEYLLLTVPLPFECETFATEAVPLAGIRLNVDILQLQELLMDIGEDELFRPMMAASGINSATLTDEIWMCSRLKLM
jgi:hypothetical protein